jgi:hypothetical protein
MVRDYYEALNLEFREEDEYTPFEELFVEQPQLPAATNELVTIDALKANNEFLGTVIDFVDEISTDKDIPVAMRNVNKGERIEMVEKLMNQKFEEKAWTNPATQSDGSKATALAGDEFKSFNEFLTFALLHEKAHETIFKTDTETIGQYEDRINQEALNKLKDMRPSLFDENKPEGLPAIDRTNETCD